MRIFLVLGTAILAGCTAGASRVDATGPTVSYDVDSRYEFEQAAERADEYCSENYGGDARLLDSGGETVTFECVD